MAEVLEKARSTGRLTEREARAIIREHQNNYPVKVSDIAHALGLALYTAPLPDNVSGKIVREADPKAPSGYVIYADSSEAPVRQRFTAAHEIAHYILHRDLIGDGITDDVLYRSELSSPLEREANELAAEILMPWHLINRLNNAALGSGITQTGLGNI